MQNGLYKAEFRTMLGEGTGVVSLENGTLRGGDSAMYYNGTYSLNGQNLTARFHVGRHSNTPGMTNVFGRDEITVDVQGTFQNGSARVTGSSPDAPGVQFQAQLTKLA